MDVYDDRIDRPLLRAAAEDGADAWFEVESQCYRVKVPTVRQRPFLVAEETVTALEDRLGPEDGWECLKASFRHLGDGTTFPRIDLDAWQHGATA